MALTAEEKKLATRAVEALESIAKSLVLIALTTHTAGAYPTPGPNDREVWTRTWGAK